MNSIVPIFDWNDWFTIVIYVVFTIMLLDFKFRSHNKYDQYALVMALVATAAYALGATFWSPTNDQLYAAFLLKSIVFGLILLSAGITFLGEKIASLPILYTLVMVSIVFGTVPLLITFPKYQTVIQETRLGLAATPKDAIKHFVKAQNHMTRGISNRFQQQLHFFLARAYHQLPGHATNVLKELVFIQNNLQYKEYVNLYRAEAYLSKGDPLVALQYLNKVFNETKETAFLFALRAQIKLELGATDEALRDVTHAISLNPKLSDAYLVRGKLMMIVRKDYSRAQADFEKVVSLDPALAQGYLLKGLISVEQAKYDDALHSFEIAEKCENPGIMRLIPWRALIYLRQGDIDLARQTYLDVLRMNPSLVKTLDELYRTMAISGDIRQSFRKLDTLKNKDKDSDLSPEN